MFDTSDTIDVCTKGIKIASVGHQIANRGCAFFVDTEGQGDEDVKSDIILLTPILLLSKVILFNWKGGVQKDTILNELAIFVEVANYVSSKRFEKDRPTFGHLNIVMRDFQLQGIFHRSLIQFILNADRLNRLSKNNNQYVTYSLLYNFDHCLY